MLWKKNRYLVLLGTLFSLNVTAQEFSSTADIIKYANESYIAVFKDRQGMDKVIEEFSANTSIRVNKRLSKVIRSISFIADKETVAELRKHDNVIFVEKNALVTTAARPNNASKPGTGDAATVVQERSYGVDRVGGPYNATGRHAWVLDTGVDENNRDLVISSGVNMINDRKGKQRNSSHDKNGHGTHIAGIIAAIDNQIDAVGVAEGATIHPVRVLDDNGIGTLDSVLAGIDYVVSNGNPGDVINLSLATPGHYDSLHNAIVNAAAGGFLFSVAAGNSAKSASEYEPAHIEHENVYTVSAIDSADMFATFSNFNNPPVDFAAPGVAIKSLKIDGGLVSYSGTSMAAPHVAGILLVKQSSPNIDGYAVNDSDSVPDGIAHH